MKEKIIIDENLVRKLIAAQFPQWKNLSIHRLSLEAGITKPSAWAMK